MERKWTGRDGMRERKLTGRDGMRERKWTGRNGIFNYDSACPTKAKEEAGRRGGWQVERLFICLLKSFSLSKFCYSV